MSTFMLDDEHFSAMLNAASTCGDSRIVDLNYPGGWVRFERGDFGRLGQILKATNLASYNCETIDTDAVNYTYSTPQRRREPVEILKAQSCYEYQA